MVSGILGLWWVSWVKVPVPSPSLPTLPFPLRLAGTCKLIRKGTGLGARLIVVAILLACVERPVEAGGIKLLEGFSGVRKQGWMHV